MKYIGIVIAVAAVLLVVLFINSYNKFVRLRNRVKDQWAQIDVQLKRRYDLIPNLVETVKGCANFEKETLESVISARSAAMNGKSVEETAAANEKLTGALHRFLAVSEGYPELKASAGFAKLQGELSETEDKIAKARQFYNDTVLKYNNAVTVFPASLIAGMTGFREMNFLEAAAEERANVKVSF